MNKSNRPLRKAVDVVALSESDVFHGLFERILIGGEDGEIAREELRQLLVTYGAPEWPA